MGLPTVVSSADDISVGLVVQDVANAAQQVAAVASFNSLFMMDSKIVCAKIVLFVDGNLKLSNKCALLVIKCL